MWKTAITTLTTLFVIFLFSSAFAADRWQGRGGGPPGREGDITAIPDLELTDEQILQIQTLRKIHLMDVRPLQNEISIKSKQLKVLWLELSPDQDKITALQAEIGKLRHTMQDKMIEYRQAIFKIMTLEQQHRLNTIGRQRGFNPGPRWGKRLQDS